jgi:hypothetical protein
MRTFLLYLGAIAAIAYVIYGMLRLVFPGPLL